MQNFKKRQFENYYLVMDTATYEPKVVTLHMAMQLEESLQFLLLVVRLMPVLQED